MEAVLVDAHTACAECRWGDARRAFALHPLDVLGIDDIDAFATASYLTGHDEHGFTLWTRAHQQCLEHGAVHRAAHFGMRLAQCLGFKGDLPRCAGWVDRTARLLHEHDIDCVESGYLEYGLAMARLFEAGDVPGALAHFTQAGKAGARFSSRELITLARIGEGRMTVYLGDVAGGMALLDEAMVAVEAGELSVLATGDAYCTIIDACAELSDVRRCRAWTAAMEHWCDRQQELVLYRGHCFIHAAEVHRVRGDWHVALVQARLACDRLAGPLPAAVGAATNLEADALRLLGRLDEAEAAYTRAHELGHQPQPGLALLRLAQARAEDALGMVRQSLAGRENPIERAALLPAFVETALAAGDVESATVGADELQMIAAELGSAMLRGLGARCAGAVLLEVGEPTAALVQLRFALHTFNEIDARAEVPATRSLLGRACAALGDHDTAALEAAAARTALEGFCRVPERVPDSAGGTVADPPDGLTARELEVLLLLAKGNTNRVIGDQLFVSEKTVASHVSHIFTKLGLTSRSAATAYAYERGLVGP